jgi:hypothetical protein
LAYNRHFLEVYGVSLTPTREEELARIEAEIAKTETQIFAALRMTAGLQQHTQAARPATLAGWLSLLLKAVFKR